MFECTSTKIPRYPDTKPQSLATLFDLYTSEMGVNYCKKYCVDPFTTGLSTLRSKIIWSKIIKKCPSVGKGLQPIQVERLHLTEVFVAFLVSVTT